MFKFIQIAMIVMISFIYTLQANCSHCGADADHHEHDAEHHHENGSANADSEVHSIHAYQAKTLSGQAVSLSEYKGKVLLIVNTASKCGLTPQYKDLENLYKTYKDRGFSVLGFPCNQFNNQEPGSAEEIKNFCTLNYGVSFPMFQKIEVNGSNTHPLYAFLKDHAPAESGQKDIRWNFTKFLVDANGNVVNRFAPMTSPKALVADIEALLKK